MTRRRLEQPSAYLRVVKLVAVGDCVVTVAELRKEAGRKRRMAETARRIGPGLSDPQDRLTMIEQAAQLEAEAAALDAQADSLV